jgi:hypothetical protein
MALKQLLGLVFVGASALHAAPAARKKEKQ